MVTRIFSNIQQIRVNFAKNPSAVTLIALAALVVFVAALALFTLNMRLKKISTPNPTNEIQKLIAQIRSNIWTTTTKNDPHSYRKTVLSILDILLNENGIARKKEGENLFIYHTHQGYPYVLVAALGGKDLFDKIPSLELPESAIKDKKEDMRELLEYLQGPPNRTTAPIMKGVLNGNPFLAISYVDKIAGNKNVAIVHCRHGDTEHWYYNASATPETFSLDNNQNLCFIGSLIRGFHKLNRLA